jgi:hypothetical protein
MPQPQTPSRPSSEFVLVNLLVTAKQVGLRPAVTLNVGGLLGAGELIDAKEYFEELANQLRDSPPGSISPEGKVQLEALFRRYAEAAVKAEQVDENASVARPYYIHLRSARIYHPGGAPIPSDGGTMWRVRLEDVGGFTFGLPNV